MKKILLGIMLLGTAGAQAHHWGLPDPKPFDPSGCAGASGNIVVKVVETENGKIGLVAHTPLATQKFVDPRMPPEWVVNVEVGDFLPLEFEAYTYKIGQILYGYYSEDYTYNNSGGIYDCLKLFRDQYILEPVPKG